MLLVINKRRKKVEAASKFEGAGASKAKTNKQLKVDWAFVIREVAISAALGLISGSFAALANRGTHAALQRMNSGRAPTLKAV